MRSLSHFTSLLLVAAALAFAQSARADDAAAPAASPTGAPASATAPTPASDVRILLAQADALFER